MLEILPPFPEGTVALFLTVVAIMVVAMAALTYANARRLGYPPRGSRTLAFDVLGFLLAWLALTGFLAWKGLLRDFDELPPQIVFVIAPAIGGLIFLCSSPRMRDFQVAMPAVWLIALQTFRLPLEMVLYQLAEAGVTPRIMTFEGRNFDIVIGASAPLVAGALAGGRLWAKRLATGWNVLGILLVLNVAVTGMLAAPTRFQVFHTEPSNSFVAHFPFVWLVAFLVPLALYLHITALRNLAFQRNNRRA